MKSELAVFRRVAYEGLLLRNKRKAVVLHTNGGPASVASLFNWWTEVAAGKHVKDGVGRHVGAHFQIAFDGTIEQYVDTDFVLGHAFAANSFAIGIETQDGGEGHEGPWKPEQLRSIVALLKELEIPPVELQETASDGVGWHSKHASWNKGKHACPTSTRVAQIKNTILPQLGKGGGTIDMAFQDYMAGYKSRWNECVTGKADDGTAARPPGDTLRNAIPDTDEAERDRRIGRRAADAAFVAARKALTP